MRYDDPPPVLLDEKDAHYYVTMGCKECGESVDGGPATWDGDAGHVSRVRLDEGVGDTTRRNEEKRWKKNVGCVAE